MVKFLKMLKSRFSMKFEKVMFNDSVNKRPVFKYKDCYGKKFFAQARIGKRMECSHE